MNNKKYVKIIYFLLTDNCNSKCITCSYWKNTDIFKIKIEDILRIINYFSKYGLDTIIFSGGEPLLDKGIFSICSETKKHFPSMELRLLTNGLLLKKYKEEIANNFDVVVISLDSSNKETYRKIRGVDGFNLVIDGIKFLRRSNNKIEIRARCMVQKYNIKDIPNIIKLAHFLKISKISFLPVDTHSKKSFSRKGEYEGKIDAILSREEINELSKVIDGINKLNDKDRKVLANNGEDLKTIYKYYFNILNKTEFAPVRCNTPNFSLVIDNKLDVYPCFFYNKIGNIKKKSDLVRIFEKKSLICLRENDLKESLICKKCVCAEFVDLKKF